MPHGHVYTLQEKITTGAAISLLQLKAGATTPFLILGARITQSSTVTSEQIEAQIFRKTVAATVTAAVLGTHLFKHRPGDPNPDLQLGTAATGHTATAEGTDGDELKSDGFNVLNGNWREPIPEGRLLVRAAGLVAVKFAVAPTSSQDYHVEVVIMELG